MQYASPDNEQLATVGVCLVILIGVILANIQVVKRLHDTNLSGWWWFLFLLPVVSYGLSIGMSFVPGTRGQNRFGPDPKEEVAYEEEQPGKRE